MSTNTNPDSIIFKIFTGTKLVHSALFHITKYACNKKTIVTTSNDAICRNYNIQSRNYNIQNDKKSLNDAMH